MYVHVIILSCDSIYVFRQTCMYMSSYYHVTVYMFLDRHVCTCCDSILCVYNPITEQYIFRQTCMYMSV